MAVIVVAVAAGAATAVFRRSNQDKTLTAIQAPNSVDIGFSQAMIQHHDQAVVMAQIMLQGERSEIFSIALSMQTSQLIQIGQMRAWLQLWNMPPLPSSRSLDWMLSDTIAPDAQILAYVARCRGEGGMPGMPSSTQLEQLRHMSGAERDRLFLGLMIQHHLGALPMARMAMHSARTSDVRELASQIAFDQQNEVQQLKLLLRAKEPAP